MKQSSHAVVAILAVVLALFLGLGVATAQVPVLPWQSTTPTLTTHQTLAASSNHVGSANTDKQSASTVGLAPSPPSTTMTVMVWIGIAAFVLGAIGVVIAALVLRRLKD